MGRRHRGIVCLVLLWAMGEGLRPSLKAVQVPSPSAPYSVVLITIDTVRADHLGCDGYRRIETPAIDKLASEGIRKSTARAVKEIRGNGWNSCCRPS